MTTARSAGTLDTRRALQTRSTRRPQRARTARRPPAQAGGRHPRRHARRLTSPPPAIVEVRPASSPGRVVGWLAARTGPRLMDRGPAPPGAPSPPPAPGTPPTPPGYPHPPGSKPRHPRARCHRPRIRSHHASFGRTGHRGRPAPALVVRARGPVPPRRTPGRIIAPHETTPTAPTSPHTTRHRRTQQLDDHHDHNRHDDDQPRPPAPTPTGRGVWITRPDPAAVAAVNGCFPPWTPTP